MDVLWGVLALTQWLGGWRVDTNAVGGDNEGWCYGQSVDEVLADDTHDGMNDPTGNRRRVRRR
jgi:hypothetical protein